MWTTCSRIFYSYSALWGMRKYCRGSTISNNDHSNEREPSQPEAEESTLLPKLYAILRPLLCKSKSTTCNASGLGSTNLDSVSCLVSDSGLKLPQSPAQDLSSSLSTSLSAVRGQSTSVGTIKKPMRTWAVDQQNLQFFFHYTDTDTHAGHFKYLCTKTIRTDLHFPLLVAEETFWTINISSKKTTAYGYIQTMTIDTVRKWTQIHNVVWILDLLLRTVWGRHIVRYIPISQASTHAFSTCR